MCVWKVFPFKFINESLCVCLIKIVYVDMKKVLLLAYEQNDEFLYVWIKGCI